MNTTFFLVCLFLLKLLLLFRYHAVVFSKLINDFGCLLQLSLALLLPIVAKLPAIQISGFFDEIDNAYVLAPLRPHADELVISTGDVAKGWYIDAPYRVDLAFVGVVKNLGPHALRCQ